MSTCAVGILGHPLAVWEYGVHNTAVPLAVVVDLLVEAAFDCIPVANNQNVHESVCGFSVLVIKAGGEVFKIQEFEEEQGIVKAEDGGDDVLYLKVICSCFCDCEDLKSAFPFRSRLFVDAQCNIAHKQAVGNDLWLKKQ